MPLPPYIRAQCRGSGRCWHPCRRRLLFGLANELWAKRGPRLETVVGERIHMSLPRSFGLGCHMTFPFGVLLPWSSCIVVHLRHMFSYSQMLPFLTALC